jgi:2-haloacid dehalogenase
LLPGSPSRAQGVESHRSPGRDPVQRIGEDARFCCQQCGLDTVIDDVFSVDELKTFKTDPAVYDMVTTAYRLYPGAVSFQSSNRWDVAGATKFGFRTIWINRARMPDEYRDLSPSLILPDLNGVE